MISYHIYLIKKSRHSFLYHQTKICNNDHALLICRQERWPRSVVIRAHERGLSIWSARVELFSVWPRRLQSFRLLEVHSTFILEEWAFGYRDVFYVEEIFFWYVIVLRREVRKKCALGFPESLCYRQAIFDTNNVWRRACFQLVPLLTSKKIQVSVRFLLSIDPSVSTSHSTTLSCTLYLIFRTRALHKLWVRSMFEKYAYQFLSYLLPPFPLFPPHTLHHHHRFAECSGSGRSSRLQWEDWDWDSFSTLKETTHWVGTVGALHLTFKVKLDLTQDGEVSVSILYGEERWWTSVSEVYLSPSFCMIGSCLDLSDFWLEIVVIWRRNLHWHDIF